MIDGVIVTLIICCVLTLIGALSWNKAHIDLITAFTKKEKI